MSGALKRDEWETVRLGDVCDDKVEKLSSSSQGEIYYVDIASINNETKEIVSPQRIDSATAPSRAKQILKKNDVLVSTVRPNLNAVAIHEIDYDIPTIASTGFCVLRCHNSLDSHYTFYFCQSDYFIKSLVKVATGASYPAVRNSDVLGVKIPLPPLDVQRRIADTLDKVTELITLRKTQLKKLDELVKARFVELFDSIEICKISKFSDECEEITAGGDRPKDTSEIRTEDFPYPVFANAATNEGLLCFSREYKIEKPCVTIAARGCTVGFTAIRYEKFTPIVRLISLVPKETITPIYLKYYIDIKMNIEGNGAAQPQLTIPMIKSMEIMVPPIELQNQFATFVEQTDKSKVIIQQSLDTLETLKKSLMQEYFG